MNTNNNQEITDTSIFLNPSILYQQNIEEQRKKRENTSKSQQYHQIKQKQYDVYGKERSDIYQNNNNLEEQELNQTNPCLEYIQKLSNQLKQSETNQDIFNNSRFFHKNSAKKMSHVSQSYNQKYLTTEESCNPTAKTNLKCNYTQNLKQNKTPMLQMRNSGHHEPLSQKTKDIKFDIQNYISSEHQNAKSTLKLKQIKDFKFTKSEIFFPFYCENPLFLENFSKYQLENIYTQKIQMKNLNMTAERVQIKLPKKIPNLFSITLEKFGLLSPGLTNTVQIKLNLKNIKKIDQLGLFLEEFQIISKHQVYTFPINLYILNDQEFQQNQQQISDYFINTFNFQKNNMSLSMEKSDLIPQVIIQHNNLNQHDVTKEQVEDQLPQHKSQDQLAAVAESNNTINNNVNE